MVLIDLPPDGVTDGWHSFRTQHVDCGPCLDGVRLLAYGFKRLVDGRGGARFDAAAVRRIDDARIAEDVVFLQFPAFVSLDDIPEMMAVETLDGLVVFDVDDVRRQLVKLPGKLAAFAPQRRLVLVLTHGAFGVCDFAMACGDVLHENPVRMNIDRLPPVERIRGRLAIVARYQRVGILFPDSEIIRRKRSPEFDLKTANIDHGVLIIEEALGVCICVDDALYLRIERGGEGGLDEGV